MKTPGLSLFLVVFIFLSSQTFAATYTSISNGSWATTTIWSPTAPAGGPSNSDVVIIRHTITRAGFTATSWSGGITIQNGGTLQYSGNLNVTGSGFTFTIQSGGSLQVSGNLTLNNQSKVTVSSGGTVTVGGSLTMDGGSTNSGTINVTGDVSHKNSGGTFANAGLLNIGGKFTPEATVNNSGTINTVNFETKNSGGTFTNTGFVTVTMTADIAGTVQLNPAASTSSEFKVQGTLNLKGSGLTVGNGVPGSPPKYADLIVVGNFNQTSHNINVNCNGRVAILGDLTLSGGGGLQFNINNCGSSGGVPIGGQVYIDGDGNGNSITNTSSGGAVSNNNPNFGSPSTPYGFYVTGPVGGTGTIDPDRATLAQMESTNPSFYAWVQSIMGPLPVTLLYFQARANDEHVTLRWATATEENSDYFSIERSLNGINFEVVGEVLASGTSSQLRKYEFRDDRPLNGRNYYRLKTVDFDNSFEYSKIVRVEFEGKEDIFVYPNPVVGQTLTVEINFEPMAYDKIQIVDAVGAIVAEYSVSALVSTLQLDNQLKSGMYLLRYKRDSGERILRFFINN